MILLAYLKWHYSVAIKNFYQIWGNFVWFIYHFFSLGVLFRTLFAPWRRLDEGYAKGLEPEKWFETLIVNVLMRAVGFIIRAIFIVVGAAVLIITIISLVPALVIWLLMPFIIIWLLITGFTFLI